MKSDQSLGDLKKQKNMQIFLKKLSNRIRFFYSKHKKAPMRQELVFLKPFVF